MRFLSIHLTNYKRIRLTGYASLDINLPIDENIQLVLGKNGSGKSSVLKALSWWPLESKMFDDGGSYTIRAEYKGATYKFGATFQGKPRYFLIDESTKENLNPSGTISVQKQLVTQLTGIDQHLQRFIHGQMRFSQMSVAERRWLFGRLADNSNALALKLYKQLQDKLRDAQGVVKYLTGRVTQESLKLVSTEREEELHKLLLSLQSEVSSCIERKTVVKRPYDTILSISNINNNKMDTLSRRIIVLNREATQRGVKLKIHEIDDVKQNLSEVVMQERLKQVAYTEAAERLLALQDKFNYIKTLVSNDRTVLEEDKARLSALLASSLSQLTHFNQGYPDADKALSWLTGGVIDGFDDIVSRLPANADQQRSPANLTMLRQRTDGIRKSIVTLTESITEVESVIADNDRSLSSNETQCPNCNHRWHKGFNKPAYDKSKLTLASLFEQKETLERELSGLNESIEDTEEYLSLLEKLQQFMGVYNQYLGPVWSVMRASKTIVVDPAGAMALLRSLQSELMLVNEIQGMSKRLAEIEDVLQKLDSETGGVLESEAECERAEIALMQVRESQESIAGHKQQLTDELAMATDITELVNELKRTIVQKGELADELVLAVSQMVVNEQLTTARLKLAETERLLTQASTQRLLVTGLEDQLAAEKRKVVIYQALTSELSPTDGLIAEIMLGFIGKFVDSMNQFVEAMWSYPIRLIPPAICTETGDVDLDYKFPVRLNGDTDGGDDVCEANSGSVEVIDLVFRIKALEQLGLSGVLFLDEFGAPFDYRHRQTVYTQLRSYFEFNRSMQVIIVNHYNYVNQLFKSPGVNILCSENIEVPVSDKINKNLRLS